MVLRMSTHRWQFLPFHRDYVAVSDNKKKILFSLSLMEDCLELIKMTDLQALKDKGLLPGTSNDRVMWERGRYQRRE